MATMDNIAKNVACRRERYATMDSTAKKDARSMDGLSAGYSARTLFWRSRGGMHMLPRSPGKMVWIDTDD